MQHLETLFDHSQMLLENPYSMVTKAECFDRIAKLLKDEHYGIEYLELDNAGLNPPACRYLNMGDTYAQTLILTDDYTNGEALILSSWGDWYEEQEEKHCRMNDVIRCGYCGEFTDLEGDWRETKCQYCGNNVSGN